MPEPAVAQPNCAWSYNCTNCCSTCCVHDGVTVGLGVAVGVVVGVAVGVRLAVMGAPVVMVAVPVMSCAGVGAMTTRLGVAVGVDGPMRLDKIINAMPTPNAKSATTTMIPTHTQVDRRVSVSSSGTMLKSSSSDKKQFAFCLVIQQLGAMLLGELLFDR